MFTFAFCVASGVRPRLKTVYNDFNVLNLFWAISYPRYSSEAIYISEVDFYKSKYPVERDVDYIGYDIDNYGLDLGLLLVLSVAWRILAFIALVSVNKEKQR